MSSRRLRGSGPGAAAVLVTLLALLLAGFASCRASGGTPATPEELFSRLQAALSAGRTQEFWDLTNEDFRQRWRDAVDNTRETAKRNPGARGMNVQQFQVSFEELYQLGYTQIFDRAHAHMERVLPGARILDRTTDPADPLDVWIVFETSAGQQFRWVMREEPAGWRLKRAEPVKLENEPR